MTFDGRLEASAPSLTPVQNGDRLFRLVVWGLALGICFLAVFAWQISEGSVSPSCQIPCCNVVLKTGRRRNLDQPDALPAAAIKTNRYSRQTGAQIEPVLKKSGPGGDEFSQRILRRFQRILR